MALWKTTFLQKQFFLHFHVSESEALNCWFGIKSLRHSTRQLAIHGTPWKTNMDPETHWLVAEKLFQGPLSGSMLVFGSVHLLTWEVLHQVSWEGEFLSMIGSWQRRCLQWQ